VDTDRILAILRSHAPELQAAGLAHLRLFGSVARGEATPHSDIDLLADFDPSARISLLTLSGLQIRLSDLLGAEVDLSSSAWLKDPVRAPPTRRQSVSFRGLSTAFG
jgi:hypothetical protein